MSPEEWVLQTLRQHAWKIDKAYELMKRELGDQNPPIAFYKETCRLEATKKYRKTITKYNIAKLHEHELEINKEMGGLLNHLQSDEAEKTRQAELRNQKTLRPSGFTKDDQGS